MLIRIWIKITKVFTNITDWLPQTMKENILKQLSLSKECKNKAGMYLL